MRTTLTFALLLLLMNLSVEAQIFSKTLNLADTTQRHVITPHEGGRLVGRILWMEAKTLVFRTDAGETLDFLFEELRFVGVLDERDTPLSPHRPMMAMKRIARNDALERRREGTFQNLIYSPTAFGFGRGHGEYRNLLFLYHNGEVGLSDHLAVGVQCLLPVLVGLRAKVHYTLTPWLHVGAGANFTWDFFQTFEGPAASHVFLIGTIGTPTMFANVTAGTFVAFEAPVENRRRVVSIGGGLRVTHRWLLRAEVLVATQQGFKPEVVPGFLFSHALLRHRFDLGFIPLGGFGDILRPIPMMGYVFSF